MRKLIIGMLQVGALSVFSLAMSELSSWLHLPIPGSIIGMVVLFILLETGVVRLGWVEIGASWLLAELLLFFVPSAIGVMKYSSLLETDGLSLLAIILAGTFIVMASSGLLTALIFKVKEGKQHADRNSVSGSDSRNLSDLQTDLRGQEQNVLVAADHYAASNYQLPADDGRVL
ncbi:holin-like protein [Paenibacillus forsythiae]|uniref:Holin-like protein n=1 Tax=Paenibacillus forsythiae TaxID=365616 RepID=A0ABU3H422_9BACL|nr:holin-like protein [Paenibacillus forsythiae]